MIGTDSKTQVMEDWASYLSPVAILLSVWWASRNAVKAIEASRDANRSLKENPDGAYLPVFLSDGNIKPYINKELCDELGRRRLLMLLR